MKTTLVLVAVTGIFSLSAQSAPDSNTAFLLKNYFASLSESVKSPQKTSPIGSRSDGAPFLNVADRPAQLVGLAVNVGDWFGTPIISSLQPIYEDSHGRFRGKVLGHPTDKLPIVIEAKPGFAVSGLAVSAPEHHVHGFKVMFRKVDLISRQLVADGSYDSDWAGVQMDDESKPVQNSTHPAVGICGRAGDWIAALGLVSGK